MRTTLSIFSTLLESDVFQLEEVDQAEALAKRSNAEVYTWKTSGSENWLIRGLSIADVLGLVILPRGLPDYIDMPDDAEDNETEEGMSHLP